MTSIESENGSGKSPKPLNPSAVINEIGDSKNSDRDEPSYMSRRVSSRIHSMSRKRRKDLDNPLSPKDTGISENSLPKNTSFLLSRESKLGVGMELKSAPTVRKSLRDMDLAPNSVSSFGEMKRTRTMPKQSVTSLTLDTLTDDEIEHLTLTNTTKNSQRNLKARFARIFQTLESLALVPEIEALPLVRPGDSTLSASTPRRRRTPTLELKETTESVNPGGKVDDSDIERVSQEDSESMDLEPESTFSQGHVFERPSVRISTGVTIVSTLELARLGREGARNEEREHPERVNARALVPRSQMLSIADFKKVKPTSPSNVMAKDKPGQLLSPAKAKPKDQS